MNNSVAFSSIALLLGCFSTILVTRPGQTETSCNQVGRVTSDGDPHHPTGSLLCKGSSLNTYKAVGVWCFDTRQKVHVSGLALNISAICRNSRFVPATLPSECSYANLNNCSDNKGPTNGGEQVLVMLNPYGLNLVERRPFLAWRAFPGAASYTVEVKGASVSWVKIVRGTSLPYPVKESPLRYGNAYKIQVFAERGDSILAGGTTVVNVLSQDKANTVKSLIQQFEKLNLPPDEAAYLDLDSVYMSQNLLNSTITSLEARVEAGSRNAVLYRTLGDRYLEAGLPERAKSEYEIAAKRAQESADIAEMQKDQAKLKHLQHQSQLPTKTNDDQ